MECGRYRRDAEGAEETGARGQLRYGREFERHIGAEEIFCVRASWGAASSAPTCVVMATELEKEATVPVDFLLQLGVFGFGFLEDWDFGVGVFP